MSLKPWLFQRPHAANATNLHHVQDMRTAASRSQAVLSLQMLSCAYVGSFHLTTLVQSLTD